jgi:hypothetical protein
MSDQAVKPKPKLGARVEQPKAAITMKLNTIGSVEAVVLIQMIVGIRSMGSTIRRNSKVRVPKMRVIALRSIFLPAVQAGMVGMASRSVNALRSDVMRSQDSMVVGMESLDSNMVVSSDMKNHSVVQEVGLVARRRDSVLVGLLVGLRAHLELVSLRRERRERRDRSIVVAMKLAGGRSSGRRNIGRRVGSRRVVVGGSLRRADLICAWMWADGGFLRVGVYGLGS